MLDTILPLIFDYLDKPVPLLLTNKPHYKTKYPLSFAYTSTKTVPASSFKFFGRYKWKYVQLFEVGAPHLFLAIPFIYGVTTLKCDSNAYINNMEVLALFTNLEALCLKSSTNLTPSIFPRLPRLKVLQLPHDKCLCDDNLKFLSHLHTLHLGLNEKITDDGLKYLAGIKSLILSNAKSITDEGLKYLSGIQELDLNFNTNITINGLKHLTGIKSLNVARNQNITDIGLMYLRGIKKLKMFCNGNITDVGLQYLTGIEVLELQTNVYLTFHGIIKYLQGIKKLVIYSQDHYSATHKIYFESSDPITFLVGQDDVTVQSKSKIKHKPLA